MAQIWHDCEDALEYYKGSNHIGTKEVIKSDDYAFPILTEIEIYGYKKIVNGDRLEGIEILQAVALAYAETSNLNKALHIISLISPHYSNFRRIIPKISDLYSNTSESLLFPGEELSQDILSYLKVLLKKTRP